MRHLTKIALSALAFFAVSAFAQEQGHLNVRTVVQKEEVTVSDDGETERRLVDAETVVPGDDLVYTITFQNISDETAENVVITNPISESLTYVNGSAFGPGALIEFSVDGGQNFAAPDALIIAANDGERAAEPADFTHVRWTMQSDIESGAQGLARFRARLN